MRNIRLMAAALLVPAALAACGSDDDSSSETTVATESSTAGSTATGDACLGAGDAVEGYEGLTEEEAAAKAEADGLQFRVVGTDGVCAAITMDLREDRVNVEIVDGVVVAAAIF
jgi:predicted outer membrane protein